MTTADDAREAELRDWCAANDPDGGSAACFLLRKLNEARIERDALGTSAKPQLAVHSDVEQSNGAQEGAKPSATPDASDLERAKATIDLAREACRAVGLAPPIGSSHCWPKFEAVFAAALTAVRRETIERCAQWHDRQATRWRRGSDAEVLHSRAASDIRAFAPSTTTEPGDDRQAADAGGAGVPKALPIRG